MSGYEEFRIELSPKIPSGGWDVTVVNCPADWMKGRKGTIVPTFTRTELRRLRNRNNWPSTADLKAIGQKVWESVMTSGAGDAFFASRQFLNARNSINKENVGLRVTMVLVGQAQATVEGDAIRLSELPFEALYNDAYQFIATDPKTPISRSLQEFSALLPPEQITVPLRVLVVVAAPTDLAQANVEEEARAVREALDPLSGPGGFVDVEFCEPPTREELKRRLTKKVHILHFIGHGGFKPIDDGPSYESSICLLRSEQDRRSDKLNADDLTGILRDTSVRLVVFTACSSSAPTPDEEPYRIGAFEGLAQRLLTGVSGILAAVAMQFDLESVPAVKFTRVFYENLLRPDKSLDEVVTLARKELATLEQYGTGHRAWVTPTVYWRCREGKVFDLDFLNAKPSPETLFKLQGLESEMGIYRRFLSTIEAQAAVIRGALAPEAAEYQASIERLMAERAQLLGESVRLHGGSVETGADFECRLTLRQRKPGVIEQVRVEVSYPADKLTFVSARPGADSPGSQPFLGQNSPGRVEVIVINPSNGMEWESREFEVGLLVFRPAAGAQPGIIDLSVRIVEVRRDGENMFPVIPLDGIVFVHAPPTDATDVG